TVLVVVNTGNQTYTDFTVSLNGINIQPGDKLFTDLLDPSNFVYLNVDVAYNLGNLGLEPYGVLIYRLEGSVGISDIAKNESLRVFPNPAIDIVSIEMKMSIINPVAVSIINMQGKVLRREE